MDNIYKYMSDLEQRTIINKFVSPFVVVVGVGVVIVQYIFCRSCQL